MSTISKRLDRTGVAMKKNEFKEKLGFALKQAAIAALMDGFGSKAWNEYMSLFANNTEQLNRLTVRAENEETWLLESRAYMVANSICGADSTTQTRLRVDKLIDSKVSDAIDNKIVDPVDGQVFAADVVVRPFRIP